MEPQVLWLEPLSQSSRKVPEGASLSTQMGTPQVAARGLQGPGGSSGGLEPLGSAEMKQSQDSQVWEGHGVCRENPKTCSWQRALHP